MFRRKKAALVSAMAAATVLTVILIAMTTRHSTSAPEAVSESRAIQDEGASVPDVIGVADVASTSRQATDVGQVGPGTNQASTSRRKPKRTLVTETPAETRILAKDGINAQVITQIIVGDAFNQAMDELAEQGSTEPQARDLTELFTLATEQVSQAFPEVGARRITCGMKLCMLSVNAPDAEHFDAWSKAFLDNPLTPVRAVVQHNQILSDGTTDFRMVFSTNPENPGLVFPPSMKPPTSLEQQPEDDRHP